MEFTFLTKDQIWGVDALDAIKKHGPGAAPTDLAILLGCSVNDDLTCTTWTASSFLNEEKELLPGTNLMMDLPAFKVSKHNEVCCVGYKGNQEWSHTRSVNIAARPALSPKEALKIKPDRKWTDEKDIRHCEYGEYPQMIADKGISEKLERLYQDQQLPETGKIYTFDPANKGNPHVDPYKEYELDGKKYIRFLDRGDSDRLHLSNSEWISEDPYENVPCWLAVKPVEYIESNGWMISEKALFAGIRFDIKKEYDGDFSKTSMKNYLDTCFAEDIEPSGRKNVRENITNKIQDLREMLSSTDEKPEKSVIKKPKHDNSNAGTRPMRSPKSPVE